MANTNGAPSPKSPGTVTVACKVPIGVELQLQRKETWTEETPTGGRDRVRFVKTGRIITVRGPAVPNGQAPEGYVRPHHIAGGYALTPGVPAEFWYTWLEENKDTDLVMNGLIFAHGRRDDVLAEAKEKRDLRSGTEALIPPGESGPRDPRIPRALNARIGNIETADEFGGQFAQSDSA
jgi:hypothetical protein